MQLNASDILRVPIQASQDQRSPEQRSPRHQLSESPALAALRLTAGDLEELACQGFVSQERRGSRCYYKLRFRRGGKQVVRYVGNADRAAMVRRELAILQTDSKVRRELRTKVKFANKLLREAKRQLEPVLNAHGFVFHGLAIRRPRNHASAMNHLSNP